MKKVATTITLMTLVLIGSTLAQPPRRVVGSTAMGGGSGVGVKNRQPMNMRKRIDKASPLKQAQNGGGTNNPNRPKGIVEVYEGKGGLAAKAQPTSEQNLGDTGTHEVGHKGKRRRGAIGEGASDVNAITKERTETVDNNESRSRKPNGRRKP